MENLKFFKEGSGKEELLDRKVNSNDDGVDVIIPLVNTNIFFEKNLYSFYREIPINRLIIGDGGITDDSLEIVNKFPRVKIIDQKKRKSLGYCIAELISLVETKWFIYLHSDVYLPENWYNTMIKYQNNYDFYECSRTYAILFEFKENEKVFQSRANSGSQMGRTDAFRNIIKKIDDDFIYRTEDIVFQELILSNGYKYGWIFDTFHFHQIMNKKGNIEPKLEMVNVKFGTNKNWLIPGTDMHVRGLVKYSYPRNRFLVRNFNNALKILKENNALNIREFRKWVKNTNKVWLDYIQVKDSSIERIKNKVKNLLIKLYNKFFY